MNLFTSQQKMFQPEKDRFILYPGSGTDLTPLLAESMVHDSMPEVFGELRRQWSFSRLMLCDSSLAVQRFFAALKPGSRLFDRSRGILHCGSGYEELWEASPLDSLTVSSVTRREHDDFFGPDKPVTAICLALEADAGGQKLYAHADFYPCLFGDLAQYSERHPEIFRFTGMFLIGMSAGREFLKEGIVRDMQFVVSDLPPPAFLPDFLPMHLRLPLYGNPQRRFSSKRGAAVYLAQSVFSGFGGLPGNTFWVVPGLFAAGSEVSDPGGYGSGARIDGPASGDDPFKAIAETFRKIIVPESRVVKSNLVFESQETISRILLEPENDEEKFMARTLDQVDECLSRQQPVFLGAAGPGADDRLGLLLGCWLVRHGMAGGEQVFRHLEALAGIAGLEQAPVPETNESLETLKNWLPGK